MNDPEQHKNPPDVFVICDAYESGYGHGLQNDGMKLGEDYYSSPEAAEAYNLGYEKGLEAKGKTFDPPEGWRLVQQDYQRIFNAIGAAATSGDGPVRISVRAFWEYLDKNQPTPQGY